MPYKHKEDLYKAQKRHRVKIRKNLLDFLKTRACTDCGEKDFRVLDFDHIDQKNKLKSISRMRSGHYSWESLQVEIHKCEVRCANCHRKKTYLQLKGGK
ncbi:MAG: hypothetical protein UW46_C0001G0121 [Candidatus Yanofskybacteria bacterium GW2011_GWF1_44_227]|uniref:HNH endonuclease n=1 Tax=Candidatus Yanofskybacteria bacterium GW2011_GWE2_40_11 TaxID=1619033 RepID=A0A0G0TTD8_9BACT|nr:MAG: hypothetical protein UT69_C0013G0050 [Candidatus Yanofskybacteria bacterium GW2011_GWE1_40_10]KKR41147.1 MAG: hypothetical protein UT75_C0001G0051 [Candidatus Yanofskybacteria bacterium GW2011_GWE2_40_11]KKT15856.1 MAG: hypothetical protein UV97_C0001G0029 [Candidatus Yanofskybacteria bacterium GW2011_GWF2_43_596]KKT53631.1 MAG: hypothetical protein UW46_C0001G0121 [Candidatus Yanofskybacteria bacterium GW2011_GWF1_44_227]OGN36244.1 MAG: hypothetical protein A2241_00680 [Candidatus Yano